MNLTSNRRQPPKLKVEYLSNHSMDCDLRVVGKIEENSEEIPKVALLSPACFPLSLNSCLIHLNFDTYILKLLFDVILHRYFAQVFP